MATTNPIDTANTWRQLNPTADPLASGLTQDCYHTVTNSYATNITVGNKKSPGMESIFALQPTNWPHDVIITWCLGYWCAKTGGLSNYSITRQGERNQNKIDCQHKKICTPFHWKHVLDGEIRGVNETKYVDIFTCSKMLIPVNIKLKHWILACIDFKQKWIAWFDSMSETHEEETRLLFTWLTREHSFNRTTKFDPGTNGPFILDRRPTPKSQRLRLRNI